MKPENPYWQYIFLHKSKLAINEAPPFAVDLATAISELED
jgi:hypothetical protein